MTGVLQETRHLAAMLGLAVALSFGVSGTPAARQACTPGIITRVGATTLNETSRSPSLSETGRYVAFESRAPDLDGDITLDVFVYDRALCTFELVSASSGGTKGNSSSQQASISGDGRFVVFESPANNLVPSDVNASFDVFVRDRLLGLTTLVSVNSAGVQPAAGGSVDPEISGNGQFVAFISDATTLVSGDTNNEHDLFVRDLVNGTTERVSISTAGGQGDSPFGIGVGFPVISPDGRFVAFESSMNTLVANDFNSASDVFLRDRQNGTTVRVSVTTSGSEVTSGARIPAMSADGRFVFFHSGGDYVPGNPACDDIFVRDVLLNTTSCPVLNRAGTGSNGAGSAVVSEDGRYLAFASTSSDYLPGDTNSSSDVFVHDMATGATRRVSMTVFGSPASGFGELDISADGSLVAFESFATNLTAGDTNNTIDIFVSAWGSLSTTPAVELMRNGTFATGLQLWQTFATPDQSYVVTDMTGGLLQFYRVPPPPGTSNQAVVFQNTWAQLLAHVPVEVRFRAGNSSTVRKRLSVLVHDGDFSDLSVCVFWLAPGAPLRGYTMRAHTTKFWTNATISFYAATAGADGGFYQLDNVSLVYQPALDDDIVDCVDPTAPAAPGGAPGPAMLTNGEFASGLAPWTTFGQITWQVAGGVFEFFRPAGAPAGVVLQSTGQALAQNEILTAALYLGNSSSARKRVTVLLHDSDFSDLSACTFWLPPQQLLSPYVMRMFATKLWANATISIYPATVGDHQWIRLDNVVLQSTPASTPLGTECLEPGANSVVAAARGLSAEAVRAGPAPGLGSRTRERATLDLGQTSAPRLRVWVPPRTSPASLQASADGVAWTTLASLAPSHEWTWVEIDLSPFAREVVHLRLAIEEIR